MYTKRNKRQSAHSSDMNREKYIKLKAQLSMKNITSDSADAWKVEMLNCEAFPEEERMPFNVLMQFADNHMMDCTAFYDGEIFVGFAVMMMTDSILYISFFAVQPELRSKGYGSCILKLLRDKFSDKQIIIDIEPIDDRASNFEQRKTRKNFYLRNGFFDSGYLWTYSNLVFEFICSSLPIKIKDFSALIEKFRSEEFKPRIFKTII